MAPINNDDDEDSSRFMSEQKNCPFNRDPFASSIDVKCNNIPNDINNNNEKRKLDRSVSNNIGEKQDVNVYACNQLDCQLYSSQKSMIKSKILDAKKQQIVNYGSTNGSKDNRKCSDPFSNKLSHLYCSGRKPGRDDDPEKGSPESIGLADIIGSFGWFQLLILIFSGLREGLVGYDALIMSIILQPESEFLCADNLRLADEWDDDLIITRNKHSSVANFSALLPGYLNDGKLNETAQCYLSMDRGNTYIIDPQTNQPSRCESWIFSNETHGSGGSSLAAEWSLVCQYHWLVAFIESAYFFGLVSGNLVWGYYADKLGRRPAYLAAHTIALVFGSLAVVSPTIYLFAFCRYMSAFGSIGYNIIYSIQVELIGVKHRSFCTIINHLGWGLGVICVPLVGGFFKDYRPIIAVAPVLSLLMYPWAFWLPESSRWLMANSRFKEARRELLRAAKFNGKPITKELDKKISALMLKARSDKEKFDCEHDSSKMKNGNNIAAVGDKNLQDSNDSDTKKQKVSSYRLIFTDRKLLRDTVILSYLAFVGHLFYYVQTINFAYVKELSVTANFITSGAGEWVSVIFGAILLKFFSRKTCMSLFLFLMTCSFAFQSFIDSAIMPELETQLIITSNNGLGTIASLLLVFVALIVNQEVYPTIVRQTGTSLTNTLGESGSTLAPLVIQISRYIGSWEANAIYSVFCLFGILASQFITKTDNIELPDT